jgi:hypothetical protein
MTIPQRSHRACTSFWIARLPAFVVSVSVMGFEVVYSR